MKQIKSETIPTTYCDAKQLAVDYQKAKMEVSITSTILSFVIAFLY